MRLGRIAKFNMIIAILLCMAFVVNLGATWASTDYSFIAGSVNTSTTVGKNTTVDYDTYTDFASAQATSGKYVYSQGTKNNQLSINYGFSQTHDLMIKFTATYSNTSYYKANGLTNRTHIANDFTLNIVNRDNWLIDMGSKADWVSGNEETDARNQTYYTMTSANMSTISGVMYYMNTLDDSGSLPVISGVTFNTSPNNSYEFIGDTLTVTLTPIYVKSKTDNYGSTHSFYSTSQDAYGFKQNSTIFTNWYTYMKNKGDEGTTTSNSTFMIYNQYVDYARGLQFPYDDSVLAKDDGGNITTGEVNPTPKNGQPSYSNTAYKYVVVGEGRNYNAITAGNKYYGGLGVHVIPSDSTLTMSIAINYFWCKSDNSLLGTTQSGIVELGYASDIQTIINSNTKHYYYKSKITKPTYVNVLDYIRLTAEISSTLILNDYRLVLNNITVELVDESNKNNKLVNPDTNDPNNVAWNANTVVPTYDLHNSTTHSPILARVMDVSGGAKTYDATVSITNNNKNPLVISGFTVATDLWYGVYTTQGTENKVNVFTKTPMGTGYLPRNREVYDTIIDNLVYDSTLWSISNYSDGVFTFTSNFGTMYIPSGYTITLISGVTIPATAQEGSEVNDFWCSLEASVSVVDSDPVYTNSSTTGVEVIVEGYYNVITSQNPGKIYIRNNTSQVITGVNLSSLNVYEVVTTINTNTADDDLLPRDGIGDELSVGTGYNLINKLNTATLSIKPGEMVLAYTIQPIDVVVENETIQAIAIISNFKISVNLESKQDAQDMNLIYNQDNEKGVLINNSDNCYEFRLSSDRALLSSELVDKEAFVEIQVNNMYYYYYKGIMCSNRCIEIFKSFVNNVVVEQLNHSSQVGITRYQYLTNEELDKDKLNLIIENFEDWEIVESDIVVEIDDKNQYQWFTQWLNFMEKLYAEPSATERENATVWTNS